MNHRININKIVLLALLSLIGKSISAQSDELIGFIKEESQNLPTGTELSIGILENGIWTKIGYRLEGNEFIETKNDDKIFEIGSITKTLRHL
ncbi:MAG: hypothetical protein R2795_01095 [Saprospiraceae bacterium]